MSDLTLSITLTPEHQRLIGGGAAQCLEYVEQLVARDMQRLASLGDWACPSCGAIAGDHSHAKKDCDTARFGESCMGFICDCDGDVEEDHGTAASPCPNARCYHCGWGGRFPKKVRKARRAKNS